MSLMKPLTGFVLEVTTGAFEKIQSDFDVFKRDDVTNEIILDASSFDEGVNIQLAALLNIPIQEFCPGYLLLYCEGKEHWEQITV